MPKKINSVAFIGLGIMGSPMAGNILASGLPIHINTRTRSKAEHLIELGARWHDSPGSAAAEADMIITVLGNPAEVESVYLAPDGLVEKSAKGAILVDCTTSSAELAERISEAAALAELSALDAPISGGEVGAKNAKLAIMVGGDRAAFERALPILELMGTNIVHQGGPGAGQHTKACNQIMIAGAILGVSEGLAYAQRNGLDPAEVLRIVTKGAANSFILEHLGPKMIERDYRPGFLVEHFIKDLALALQSAKQVGLELSATRTALEQYRKLSESGFNLKSTHVLYEAYDPITVSKRTPTS